MVLEERDRARGDPAEKPGRPAGVVAQTPELGVRHRSLQDALGGEVEERARAVRVRDPVHQPRSRPVLVVRQRRALPVHVHPVLAHVERGVLEKNRFRFFCFVICFVIPSAGGVVVFARLITEFRRSFPKRSRSALTRVGRFGRERASDVLLDVLRREPAHEVEPEPPEPDLVPQPRHPALQREPELGVGVVEVRSGSVVLPRVRPAFPEKRGVVAGDGPVPPVDGLAVRVQVREHVPRAVHAARVRGAVVDHHVAHGRHADGAKARAQRDEVLLAAVPARVELEQTAGEVPFRARALARRRQPEVRHADRRDRFRALGEPLPVRHRVRRVPRVEALGAGPVEALHEHDVREGVFRDAAAGSPDRERHQVLDGGVRPVVQRRRLERVVPLEHVVLPEVIEHVAVVRVAAQARLAADVGGNSGARRAAALLVDVAQARELRRRDLVLSVCGKTRRGRIVPRRRRVTVILLLAVQPGGDRVQDGGVFQGVHLHGRDFFVGVPLRIGRASGVRGRVRVLLGVHHVRPRVPHLPVARRGDPCGARGGVRVVLVVRTGPAVRERRLALHVRQLVAFLAALGGCGDARDATRTRNTGLWEVPMTRRARARGAAGRERRARAGGEHSGPRRCSP